MKSSVPILMADEPDRVSRETASSLDVRVLNNGLSTR